MSRKLAPIRVYLALCERDANAADLAATDLSNDNTWGPGPLQFNREFTQGLIAGMQGDTPKAQAAFSAAYLIQEKIVQAQPDYAPALCMQGLIEAALGRKAEALRDGRRAAELNLSIDGTVILDFLAVIYAWAGEPDLAVEQMQKMIQLPGLTGYGQLKLLPFFDPLRGDPRFEKLVANLAPKD